MMHVSQCAIQERATWTNIHCWAFAHIGFMVLRASAVSASTVTACPTRVSGELARFQSYCCAPAPVSFSSAGTMAPTFRILAFFGDSAKELRTELQNVGGSWNKFSCDALNVASELIRLLSVCLDIQFNNHVSNDGGRIVHRVDCTIGQLSAAAIVRFQLAGTCSSRL